MDFASRLIALILLAFSSQAFSASFWAWSSNPTAYGAFPSASSACSTIASSAYKSTLSNTVSVGSDQVNCSTASGASFSVLRTVCSASQVINKTSASCVSSCPSGFNVDGSGFCYSDPQNCLSLAGKPWPAPSSGGAWNSWSRKAYTFCPDIGGTTTCLATGSAIYTGVNGNNYITGPWTYTGGLCATAGLGTGSETQAPTACPAGRCPGTVNGQSVCVACASITEGKSTQVSTAASSAASGATTTTTSTSGSSSSSSTTCAGSQCTTTTTTTTQNPDGSKGETSSTKTEAKSDFCTTNPKAAACADPGGSWGGSCGAFSCDGDAVTCAIAQASWKSACALDIEASDSKVQAGNSALSAGVRSAEHPGNNPDTRAFSASINTSNPYGSACPSDFVLNAYNHAVTVPLSSACDVFTWMGRLAVALALLTAGRIVFA